MEKTFKIVTEMEKTFVSVRNFTKIERTEIRMMLKVMISGRILRNNTSNV